LPRRFPIFGISRNPFTHGLILDISPRILEKVLYFAMHIVIDPGDTPLKKYDPLDEKDYEKYREYYEDAFKAGMGAEQLKNCSPKLIWTSFR